jgi:hypothetical protein
MVGTLGTLVRPGGAFIGRPGEDVLPGHETRPVPLIALDTYPLPRPISFIKIDVEGAEPQALRGAARVLRRYGVNRCRSRRRAASRLGVP